jgi:phosphohistidine phosphatase
MERVPPRRLTLHLLRHAKSSWDPPQLEDGDRPLAPRGERAARKLARHLAALRVAPDLVLCSSALRARQTLQLIGPALPRTADVLIEDGLYGAAGRDLLDRLRRVGAGAVEVMLVGHNPGIHDLALTLGGNTAPESMIARFPTGALVSLRPRATAWEQLQPGSAEITRIVLPRDL